MNWIAKINPMPCLTMNKIQPGKSFTQPFLSGVGSICLLLLVLWPVCVLAEPQEATPVQQQTESVTKQQEPTAVSSQPVQTAEELAAQEEENTKVANALEELLKSMNTGEFVYQVEERPDPFMPFISEKILQSTDSESGEPLTGMRQLEPGQLTLTAIIFTEANPMAMVEDSSHKGYVIHRGTRIGKFGIVTDILPNSVIIKQLSYSMNQEKKYTTVEMILRKEGEK